MRWHRNLSRIFSTSTHKKNDRRLCRVLLCLEELETRSLLSASSLTAAATASALDNLTAQSNTTIAPAATSSFTGYTPQQLRTAYGVPSTLNGQPAGTGETIAIVDAYNDPKIASDLAMFSSKYGLPAANLTVVNQNGGSALPANSSSWGVEESLDVEWAHAIAPGAKIVLVEANSNSLNDLLTAVSTATSKEGANVVSMSWGAGEFNGETAYDSYFNAPGVTYVASAGDSSANYGPVWPASSPNVLAVGGTTLKLTSSNAISSETAWSATYSWFYGWEGGGGGISSYEATPTFQSSNGVSYGGRSTPDVAWDANPSTGVSVYDSYGQPGWGYVGGTSAGAPAWAGIAAIADQNSGQSLSTAEVENALYGAYSTGGSAYSSTFRDITSGNNGYAATPGYDLATGLGSPKVSTLISSLFPAPASAVRGTASTTTSSTIGGTTTLGSQQGTTNNPAHPHVVLEIIDVASVSAAPAVTGSSNIVSLTIVPASVPTSSSSGGSTSAFNTLSSFTQSFGQSSMSVNGSTPLASGSGNASVPQSPIVFGASGLNNSAWSSHLSSLGLPAPSSDQLGSLVPEDGEEDGVIPLATNADSGGGDATVDWLLFDSALMGVFDGEVSGSVDAGDGGADGE